MLKRFYVQISSLMILGTVVLLLCFGGIVYLVLDRQLRTESETSLRSEFNEVHDHVVSDHWDVGDVVRRLDTSDDLGLSIYTLIHTQNGNYTSDKAPVSTQILLQRAVDGTFVVFVDHNRHYRVFSNTFTQSGHPVRIITYQSTQQAYRLLEHVRNLLLLVGTAGVLCAVLFHLWLARKALIPAQKTWKAHQDMMMELSHELQTPLATMNAIVSIHVTDPDVKADLSREILEASALVKDILYLSRLNSKSFQVELQPTAVSDLTDEVIERFTPLLQKKRIHLKGFSQPGLFLLSTPEMWTRLMSTLCKNVVDHAEDGTEATWSLTADAHTVRFRLQNQARTMHPTSKRSHDTTRGLGMQIARRIVEEMHGNIDVQREGDSIITTVSVPRKTKL